jgi:phage tail-like protein
LTKTIPVPSDIYPPAAFYFRVTIGTDPDGPDTSFMEVSGISAELETEDVVEGGENRYTLKLPKAKRHGNLELKRGIASIDSPLVKWCIQVLEADLASAIELKGIRVDLMNEDKTAIRAWNFIDAYPVKWEVESFGSTKNEVAIEKIALTYTLANRII